MHEYEWVLTSGFVRYKIKVGYDITGAKIMGDKIRVAIVEDEQEAAKKLISFFNKYAYENSVLFETECYSDGESFIDSYAGFDIVLMDIELTGMNGLDTVRKLRALDDNIMVIFVTNMAQFAVQGYEVEAFDFMVKPFTYYSFSVRLSRALKRLKTRRSKDLWVSVTHYGKRRISSSDIKYIEVMGHKITYHTVNGNFESFGSMQKVQEDLKGLPFELCNRCYLVNLRYVTGISGFALSVDGDELQISHLKRNEFLKKLNMYMSGEGGDGNE